MRRTGRFLARALLLIVGVTATAWALLTLHFAPLFPPPIGDVLAGLIVLALVVAFARLRLVQASVCCLVASAVVLGAFQQLRPTNDRRWEPEYAIPASVTRNGNIVRIANIRNFAWTSDTTATPGYYDAEFNLNDVSGVDLILSYWAGDAIAHVFVSFAFADGRHLAVSVETRRAVGKEYSTLGGFFRNYELFYVLADERDLIGVRTDMRHERLYIYRLLTPPGAPRLLLMSYLEEAAALPGTPQFYNTIDNNCVSNVVGRAAAAASAAPGAGTGPPFSWKLLVSGYADSYAYDLGRLDQSLPFATLKAQSLVRRNAGEIIGPDFSARIRGSRL